MAVRNLFLLCVLPIIMLGSGCRCCIAPSEREPTEKATNQEFKSHNYIEVKGIGVVGCLFDLTGDSGEGAKLAKKYTEFHNIPFYEGNPTEYFALVEVRLIEPSLVMPNSKLDVEVKVLSDAKSISRGFLYPVFLTGPYGYRRAQAAGWVEIPNGNSQTNGVVSEGAYIKAWPAEF